MRYLDVHMKICNMNECKEECFDHKTKTKTFYITFFHIAGFHADVHMFVTEEYVSKEDIMMNEFRLSMLATSGKSCHC